MLIDEIDLMDKVTDTYNGITFEHVCENVLKKCGFEVWEYNQYKNVETNSLPEKLLVKKVPYRSYYPELRKRKPRTEFVLLSCNIGPNKLFGNKDKIKLKIRIECKWQSVSGSAYEKITHRMIDLRTNAKEDYVLLIMDGKEIPKWYKQYVRDTHNDEIIRNKKRIPNILKYVDFKGFVDFCQEAFKN